MLLGTREAFSVPTTAVGAHECRIVQICCADTDYLRPETNRWRHKDIGVFRKRREAGAGPALVAIKPLTCINRMICAVGGATY